MLYSTEFFIAKNNPKEFTHVNTQQVSDKLLKNEFEKSHDSIYLICENFPTGHKMYSIVCLADVDMLIDTENYIPTHMEEKYEILSKTRTDYNPIMTTTDFDFSLLIRYFIPFRKINNITIYEVVEHKYNELLSILNSKISKLVVLDGHHRLNAIRKCGFKHIMVSITHKNNLRYTTWIPLIHDVTFNEFDKFVSSFASTSKFSLKYTSLKNFGIVHLAGNYFETVSKIIEHYSTHGIEYLTLGELSDKLKDDTISLGYDSRALSFDHLFNGTKLPRKTTNFVKHTSGIIAYKR